MPTPFDEHASDEELSAIADGEAPRTAHVAGCGPCTARVQRFSELSNAVRAPVPALPPDDVDRLVGAALADNQVIRLADRRRPFVARPWVMGVAAAVLIVAGIPALVTLMRTPTTNTSATLATDNFKSRAESASTVAAPASGTAATGSSPMAASSGALSAVPHLGAIDTVSSLVDRLRSEPSARQAAATSADSSAASPTSQPQAQTYRTDCEAAVRRGANEQLGALDYDATLLWQGTDAEVFVFERASIGGGSARDAFVTARSDCRELARQRF